MHIAKLPSSLILGLFLLGGCRESVGVITAHDQGKGKAGGSTAATYDDAWKAAHIALHWNEAGTPRGSSQQGAPRHEPSRVERSELGSIRSAFGFEQMNPQKTRA